MALRRSLSDITQLEMRVQEVQAENVRLMEENAQLKRAPPGVEQLAAIAAAAAAAATMRELLQQQDCSVTKKKKQPMALRFTKSGHLKNVQPGELLTQPQIVAQLTLQEAAAKQKVERKETEKKEAQELKRKARTDAAAATKRKEAEGAPAARKKRQVAKPAEVDSAAERKEEEEKKVEEPLWKRLMTRWR